MRGKKIEAFGVAVLCYAAIWEIHLIRNVQEYLAEAQTYQFEQKLGLIWDAVGSSTPAQFVASNSERFLESTRDKIQNLKERFGFEWQVYVRTAMYVLGSSLIVVGKWRDGAGK